LAEQEKGREEGGVEKGKGKRGHRRPAQALFLISRRKLGEKWEERGGGKKETHFIFPRVGRREKE